MAVKRRPVCHFLVSILLLTLHFDGFHAANVMSGQCGNIIDMVSSNKFSGVLDMRMPESLSQYSDPTLNLHCDVRILFDSGLQLQIELYNLDIMPVSADQTVCSTGLEVFEKYTGRNVYGGRLCMEGWEWEERHIEKQREKKIIESSPLTFRLVSDAPYRGTGFKVHYNVFRPNAVCMRREFRCREFQRCISDDLTCDGWDDCGDDSDEGYDAGCGLLTATEIVAVIVGIFLFLETIIIIIFFCIKYRKFHKTKSLLKITLANSSQNLKPSGPESVISFPYRVNSMESMNKSQYSRRTGTRRDSDSSIDKHDLEKFDRHSYRDNASERSYKSRQSKNGHYQKRRSRGSSPVSATREKVDPVSSSLKGSQVDLMTNSDRDASDKDKVYRERDSERERDRKYGRDRRRDDQYSDSDDRSPPRRRRSRDRRRYDRSSDDDDYDSEYEEERRRRRRRRSQDRRSRDRYEDDPDNSDNSDNERRRRRRRSRDRYEDDPNESGNSDSERRRRKSRDRYNRDEQDYSDDDRDNERRRRRSRDRARDKYDREPDSYDDEDSRPPRRRKPSQERDRRRVEENGRSAGREDPNRERDRRQDDVGDDSSSQPSYRQPPSQEKDENRQRGRSRQLDNQQQPPNMEKDQSRKPDERRLGSRENILSPQNLQRHSPIPPTPSKADDLRRRERPGISPSQPPVDDNKSRWKPRGERRRNRQSQDELTLQANGENEAPPVYEDVMPKGQLENLGYREESV